jgi:hypothetical protein
VQHFSELGNRGLRIRSGHKLYVTVTSLTTFLILKKKIKVSLGDHHAVGASVYLPSPLSTFEWLNQSLSNAVYTRILSRVLVTTDEKLIRLHLQIF